MTPSENELKKKLYYIIKDINDSEGNPYFSVEWIKTNILGDDNYKKYTKRKKIIDKLINGTKQ